MIQPLSKEQAIVITGYTGYLACDWHEFHLDAEKRLGRPIWTNEFAFNHDEIKAAYRQDFLDMIPKKEKN